MAIDLSTLTSLTVQIDALNKQLPLMTDPGAKSLVQAQVIMLQAQLASEAQHMQAQADASSNLLDGLGLFQSLTTLVGNSAPTIISLFKK